MKIFKNFFIVTVPTIFISLLILEIFFRIVIPACYYPRCFFNEKEKLICISNTKEKGLFTFGKFAQIRTKWRINNMHWNYPIDYYPVQNKKLIAVIGDSYIEAFQVDVDKNYPYLLRENLKTNYEVYAFGKSGFPLSQYLHVGRYVNKYFHPNILIFNLVHNDFDESIYELCPVYYFLQVSINKDGLIKETIPRADYSTYQYTAWKRIIFKSALVRYLWINLKFVEIRDVMAAKDRFEANICPKDVQKKKDLIFKVTNYLIKTIRDENSDKRIIFIMDAPRDAIYRNELGKSSVLWMNAMMEEICDKYNVEYIDLTPLMQQDYKINHKKFDFELDDHWNEYGHNFVANVLYEYLENHRQKD